MEIVNLSRNSKDNTKCYVFLQHGIQKVRARRPTNVYSAEVNQHRFLEANTVTTIYNRNLTPTLNKLTEIFWFPVPFWLQKMMTKVIVQKTWKLHPPVSNWPYDEIPHGPSLQSRKVFSIFRQPPSCTCLRKSFLTSKLLILKNAIFDHKSWARSTQVSGDKILTTLKCF